DLHLLARVLDGVVEQVPHGRLQLFAVAEDDRFLRVLDVHEGLGAEVNRVRAKSTHSRAITAKSSRTLELRRRIEPVAPARSTWSMVWSRRSLSSSMMR